jgi:hypothetical protein
MNLLLVAVLLLQDKTAENAFRKAEESLEKAKTFQVVMTGTPTGKPRLTLMLKEGNKLSLWFEVAGGLIGRASVFSDGNEMSIITPPRPLPMRL